MRVNMDSSLVADPRFKLLAFKLEVEFATIIGYCYLTWLACYERRSKCLSRDEANACVGVSKWSDVLLEVGLADECDEGISIHGVDSRIEFLKSQAKKGRKGGRSRAKPEASKSLANASGDDKQMLSPTPTPTPTLDPTLTPTDTVPGAGAPAPRSKGVSKRIELMADSVMAKWNEYFHGHGLGPKRSARAWAKHVAAADRAGYSERQQQAACWGVYRLVADQPDFAKKCRPDTALRLSSREGRACLPQWIEQAEISWREEYGNESYPWLADGDRADD